MDSAAPWLLLLFVIIGAASFVLVAHRVNKSLEELDADEEMTDEEE